MRIVIETASHVRAESAAEVTFQQVISERIAHTQKAIVDIVCEGVAILRHVLPGQVWN